MPDPTDEPPRGGKSPRNDRDEVGFKSSFGTAVDLFAFDDGVVENVFLFSEDGEPDTAESILLFSELKQVKTYFKF